MILRQLYLYPDLVEFQDDITSNFRDQSRCLCNYLERETLKKSKFQTENFNRICIIGSSNPSPKASVLSTKVATIETMFSPEEYKAKSGNELQDYFISLLTDGLSILSKQTSIPLEEILASTELFRKSGYQNEWVHKSKRLKGTKLVVSLCCKLTMSSFALTFNISKESKHVFSQVILTTPPDEIAFGSQFKDLILNETDCVVTDKFNEVIYRKNVQEFL